MKLKLLVLAAAVVSILGVQAYAHHSFAATYFEDQKVTVKGKLVQFLYRNPHSFVHVDRLRSSISPAVLQDLVGKSVHGRFGLRRRTL